MSWGLDDLEKFVNGLRGTFAGKKRPGFNPASDTTNAAIVNPLRLAAEFSGATQAYKASKPNASALDQGLGMLALLGYLGGVDEAVAGGGQVINALKPEYEYGIHVSPVSNLKRIRPNYGPSKLGNFGDHERGYAYMFSTSPELNKATDYSGNFQHLNEIVNEYMTRLLSSPLKNRTGNRSSGSTAYLVRTPKKFLSKDLNMGMGTGGDQALKTRLWPKVIDSIQQSPVRVEWDWGMAGRPPQLDENYEDLIANLGQLIKKDPRNSLSSSEEISGAFKRAMERRLLRDTERWDEERVIRGLRKESKKVVAIKKR